jgi:phosphatidylglycerophosphate synthase
MRVPTQAVVLCAADRGSPLRKVAGLSLLERLLRQLGRLPGIAEIIVVSPPDTTVPQPSAWVRAPVRCLHSNAPSPWEMLAEAADSLHNRFLIVAADLVVDQRVFAWLSGLTQATLVRSSADDDTEILGVLHKESLSASAGAPADTAVLPLSSLPAYSQEMRGEVSLHVLRITDEAGAQAAWGTLLDNVEKRTKDLPAEYVDPPLENALVRWLAPTSVTPNQITVFSTAIGFLVAVLFWKGWLILGIALAFAVEVLDGVDGKLARLKHMTSKFGEFEHIFDFFYENAWYIGIGAYLAGSGSPWAWTAAWVMVGFDLADNLVYTFYSLRYGRHLDQTSVFLRRFRLIGGRRNIYAWMFAPGFLLGFPALSFALAVAWAGVTATVHALFALRGPAPEGGDTGEPQTSGWTDSA